MKLLLDSDSLEIVAMATEAQRSAAAPVVQAIAPKVSGGVASIPVKGPLLSEPSWIHLLFGIDVATYSAIGEALQQAELDPRVSSIQLDINSPGGSVEGLFEFVALMDSVTKPIHALVTGQCCSAAYLIASQADTVESTSEAAAIGSIGVVTTVAKPSAYVVDITSTDAPKKRPDPTTAEGVAAVREYLDQIHELFVERVASGRNVSMEAVNRDFGRGGVMSSRVALRVGMIDRISTLATGGGATKGNAMNLSELKAAHPSLCAELVAEGVEKGKAEERERVAAHAKLGRELNCLELSIKAIEEGKDLGPRMVAEYMVTGKATAELAARAADVAPQTNSDAPVVDASGLTQLVAAADAAYDRLKGGI